MKLKKFNKKTRTPKSIRSPYMAADSQHENVYFLHVSK